MGSSTPETAYGIERQATASVTANTTTKVAVVSTPLGVAGLPVVAGEHAPAGGDATAFAAAIDAALADHDARVRVATAARDLVAAQFTWAQTLAPLLRLVEG